MRSPKPRYHVYSRFLAHWSDEVPGLALIYVKRKRGKVARTVESAATVLTDVDADGRVLGVEVLASLPANGASSVAGSSADRKETEG